jgi:hypothetical protein
LLEQRRRQAEVADHSAHADDQLAVDDAVGNEEHERRGMGDDEGEKAGGVEGEQHQREHGGDEAGGGVSRGWGLGCASCYSIPFLNIYHF